MGRDSSGNRTGKRVRCTATVVNFAGSRTKGEGQNLGVTRAEINTPNIDTKLLAKALPSGRMTELSAYTWDKRSNHSSRARQMIQQHLFEIRRYTSTLDKIDESDTNNQNNQNSQQHHHNNNGSKPVFFTLVHKTSEVFH